MNTNDDDMNDVPVGGVLPDEDSSGEPLEAAMQIEDMDPESRMILKEELEEKLKAGKKLSESEMEMAEQLMGEDILKYLEKHKEAAAPLDNPLPEEEEEEVEAGILRKILASEDEDKEPDEEELLRIANEGK